MACTALVLTWFYAVQPGFGAERWSAFCWLASSWNSETDYEHAWMVPLIALFMLYHARARLAASFSETTSVRWAGLVPALGGALLFVASFRTVQGRLAIGALPFLLTGAAWFYGGRRAARMSAFPFFFLWMAIPLPGFQQATVGMQLLATQAAHWLSGLFGVPTIVEGTNILSANGTWDTYSIAGGCSGMRSLMALLMISTAWAYLAPLTWWKKCLLALAAIPLAILGNAFRVGSIFICAEYINPAFASKTWHDWSGLLFFFPASLAGLALLHALLAGEIPFLKRRRCVVVKNSPAKGGDQ